MTRALVLGSGIVGLWTAEVLAHAGHQVHLLSDSEAVNSTSAAAACVLVPFLPGDPASPVFKRSVRWARETVEHMIRLDANQEFLERMPCYEFGQKGIVEYGFSVITLDFLDFSKFELIELERPVAGCDMAVGFDCYLCNSGVFLRWLSESLKQMGVSFEFARLAHVSDIPWKRFDVVFNCLGYQLIFPDDELYPVLGQSMFIPEAKPVSPAFGIGAGPHAVFAQRRGFHIGAHFVHGLGEGKPTKELYQSSMNFVQGPYRELCESVGRVPPAIDLDTIDRVNVGIRPFRWSGPRVEVDRTSDRLLIHNYGHGAHGWTTGYGSALEAVSMARMH